MEALAEKFLRNGDVANATTLYTSLEKLHPARHNRMARICRVLHNPSAVPLPHRHRDICEALLDPLVPPEILVDAEGSAEGVSKRYQRLVVIVHPDKNPSPKAKEAFQRLALMKDKALELAAARRCEQAAAQNAGKTCEGPHTITTTTTTTTTIGGHSNASPAHRAGTRRQAQRVSAQTSPSSSPPAAPSLSSQLAELKSTRITLKSLRRREIDEDFEIFSFTHRNAYTYYPDHVEESSSNHIGDDDGVDEDEVGDGADGVRLASTAPEMTLPPAVPPGGLKGRKRVMLRSIGRLPWASAQGFVAQTRDAATQPLPLSPAHLRGSEHGKEAMPLCAEPCGSEDGHSASAESSNTTAKDGLTNTTTSRSVSTADTHNTTTNEGRLPHGGDAVRAQIDRVIADLGHFRLRSTQIQLTCDLSFAAYEEARRQAAIAPEGHTDGRCTDNDDNDGSHVQ